MTEAHDFETSLRGRLEHRASLASRPFDAHSVAMAAIRSGTGRHIALRPAVPIRVPAMAWAWLAILALLAVVGASLLAGAPATDPLAGRWLAVTREDGVWLAREDGTGLRPLLAADDARGLRWSPDGTMLAVIGSPSDPGPIGPPPTTVVRLDGSIVWQSAGGSDVEWVGAAGHRIAWRDDTGVSRVVDLDTGRTEGWSETEGTVERDESPDGSRAVVRREEDDHWALRVVTLDGSAAPVDLPVRADGAWNARWSPDGTRVLFVSYASAGCGQTTGRCPSWLSIADATTGDELAVTPQMEWILDAGWSPDGSRTAWTAFTDQVQSLFVSDASLDPASTERFGGEAGAQVLMTWSSDGTSVLVGRVTWTADNMNDVAPYELLRVPLDGGDPVHLLAGVGSAALQPAP